MEGVVDASDQRVLCIIVEGWTDFKHEVGWFETGDPEGPTVAAVGASTQVPLRHEMETDVG